VRSADGRVAGADPRRGSLLGRRLDPDARAGLRLTLSVLGAVLLALVLGPLALLVHDRWGPLQRLDVTVSRAAERLDRAHPAVVTAARLLTHLGDPAVVTTAAVAAVAVLLAARRPRPAVFVAAVRLGTLVLSGVTKTAVGRARPRFEDPVAHAFGASFPSGHALGSSSTWLALALVVLPLVARGLRPWLLVAAVAVALVVCATRVLLGVHYLSDVTAGFVLGTAWTAVCAAVVTLWRAEQGRRTEPLSEGIEPELGAHR
jgi:membrane-associated phospholipid phosphatase